MSTTRIKGVNGVIIDSKSYLELPKGEQSDAPASTRPGMIRYNFVPEGADPSGRGLQVAVGPEPATGDTTPLEWRNVALLVNGQLDSSMLPSSVQGKLEYRGTWNATTNTPALPDLPNTTTGATGFYYIVTADGNGNGANDLVASDIADGYKIGDWVVSTGTQWDKIDYTAASTTAGNVALSSAAMRSGKHNMATAALAQIGFERLVYSSVDRITGDEMEGTLTFDNASDSAYLRLKDGSASAPGLSFSQDTNLGLYRISSNSMGITTGNHLAARFENAQIRHHLPLRSAPGTAAAPQFSFYDDTNMGMFRSADNRIGFSTDGVARVTIDSDKMQADNIRTDNGTTAKPAYSFTNDHDTGIRLLSTSQIALVAAGADRLVVTNTIADFNVNVKVPVGSVTVPSYSFEGDSNTGFYHHAADQLGITTGGVLRFLTRSSGHLSRLPFHAPTATATAPTYSFEGDENTGIFRPVAESVGIAANGTEITRFYKDYVTNNKQLRGANGTVTSPHYSFASDANTGMYHSSEGVISFSCNNSNVMSLSANSMTLDKVLTLPNGSATAPSLRFASNTDTGLYSANASSMSVTVDKNLKMTFNVADIVANKPIRGQRDSASAPTFGFTADKDTGMYNIAENRLGFTTGGHLRLELNNSSAVFKTNVFAPSGSINATSANSRASFGFDGDENTGMYRSGTNQIGFMTAGQEQLRIQTDAVISNLPYRGANGSVSVPHYSFASATNSGMYHAGSHHVAIASNGVEVFRAAPTVAYMKRQLNMGTGNRVYWTGTGGRLASVSATNDATRLHFVAPDSNEPFSFGNSTTSFMKIHPSAMVMPSGEKSSVATPIEGMIRFQPSDDTFYGFYQDEWQDLSGAGKLRGTGSAGTPSMYWESDPNTGFFHHATAGDNFSVVTGGVERVNYTNTLQTVKTKLRVQTSSGYVDIGPANTSHMHFSTDRSNFYFNKEIQVAGDIELYNGDTKLDYATGKIQENGRWLDDKYFTYTPGSDTTNVDTMIKNPVYNGVYQRANTGPVGYAYGTLTNLSTDTSNFQIYAPHHEGGVSAMYFRTGWENDIKAWKRVQCVGDKSADSDKFDGLNSTQFLRSDVSDTMTGQLIFNRSTTIGSASNLGNAWALFGTTTVGIGIDNNEIVGKGQDTNIRSSHKLILDGTSVQFDGPALMSGAATVTGTLTANGVLNSNNSINMGAGTEIVWNQNTDGAKLGFKNTADGDTDSYMYFETEDNRNEYFKFSHRLSGATTSLTWMDIKSTGINVTGKTNTIGDWSLTNKVLAVDGNTALSSDGTTLTVGGHSRTVISGEVSIPNLVSGSTGDGSSYITQAFADSRYIHDLGEMAGSVDLNTKTQTGRWSQTSNSEAASGSNYPVSVAGNLTVINDTADTMIYQYYHSYGPNNHVYYRTRYSNTWSVWKHVADTASFYNRTQSDARYQSISSKLTRFNNSLFDTNSGQDFLCRGKRAIVGMDDTTVGRGLHINYSEDWSQGIQLYGTVKSTKNLIVAAQGGAELTVGTKTVDSDSLSGLHTSNGHYIIRNTSSGASHEWSSDAFGNNVLSVDPTELRSQVNVRVDENLQVLGSASCVGNITAATAPTAASHLTNKAYVDSSVASATGGGARSNRTINLTVDSSASGWTSSSLMTGKTRVGGVNVAAGVTDAYLSFANSSGKMHLFVDGEIYCNEGRGHVYHTLNKPTAADVGALSITGKAANSTLLDGSTKASIITAGQAATTLGGRSLAQVISDARSGRAALAGSVDQEFHARNIVFKAGSSDSASIGTDISGTTTHLTFRVSDDPAGNDSFKWNFGITGDATRTLMQLYPTAAGANTGHLKVNGEVNATGNITAFSDIRVKTDIKVIENALDKVDQIRGVTYERTDMQDSRQVGFVAQELEVVLPEAVRTVKSEELGIDDFKTVAYGNVSALLVEAVKEEKAKREALETEVAELKALVQALLNK